MGLFDQLGGALKGVLGEAAPGLIAQALAGSQFGNLQNLVAQLQQGGLGQQVSSWLSNGANMPVSADQIRSALGNEQVHQMAQSMGLPVDQLLNMLSQHLPTAVDQASPNGTIESN